MNSIFAPIPPGSLSSESNSPPGSLSSESDPPPGQSPKERWEGPQTLNTPWVGDSVQLGMFERGAHQALPQHLALARFQHDVERDRRRELQAERAHQDRLREAARKEQEAFKLESQPEPTWFECVAEGLAKYGLSAGLVGLAAHSNLKLSRWSHPVTAAGACVALVAAGRRSLLEAREKEVRRLRAEASRLRTSPPGF